MNHLEVYCAVKTQVGKYLMSEYFKEREVLIQSGMLQSHCLKLVGYYNNLIHAMFSMKESTFPSKIKPQSKGNIRQEVSVSNFINQNVNLQMLASRMFHIISHGRKDVILVPRRQAESSFRALSKNLKYIA